MTQEEVEALERAYEEAVARGEIEDKDRYCWEPGDVLIFNNMDEMKEKMAEEGYEFIPVSQMKHKSKRKKAADK